MSTCRKQAMIERPVDEVWELLGDPSRHPEWWPRVVEVRGEQFDEGDSYAQVTDRPGGRELTTFMVERRDDLHSIRMRCLDTGMFVDWRITEAQAQTFVDAEMGMDPQGLGNRVFDITFGRPYFRRWLSQSMAGLKAATERGE